MKTSNAVEQSLKISTPSWPMQNIVAVNPFWFMRETPFERGIDLMSASVNVPLMMQLEFYKDKLKSGEISNQGLASAFIQAQSFWSDLPKTLEEFEKTATMGGSDLPHLKTFAETNKGEWASRVTFEVGKYCSAYFDEHQALASFPWGRGESFWSSWVSAQEFDRSMDALGANGFSRLARALKGYESDQFVEFCLDTFGLQNEARIVYCRSLLATVLGWSSQFRYQEWQKTLGYKVTSSSNPGDLLAVRLAYDFVLFSLLKENDPPMAKAWLKGLEKDASRLSSLKNSDQLRLQYIYHLAWELTYQSQVFSALKANPFAVTKNPRVQMAFCIDVRSEMLRRHIETVDPTIQTIGFAGFFGLPFDYKRPGEGAHGHRLPVLLQPAFTLGEGDLDEGSSFPLDFFRQMRKNSLSSFSYVELFGGFYIGKMIKNLASSMGFEFFKGETPDRFVGDDESFANRSLFKSDGHKFTVEEKADRMAWVLRHMGLTSEFAPQVWIIGHGSETQNNAFGSSLDCGACGGHAGDINARLLVDLLNDRGVRVELTKRHKIKIPAGTVFVAAVHETVTDQVFPVGSQELVGDSLILFDEIKAVLGRASESTQKERLKTRSLSDSDSDRRSRNWAEVRPEWGLAGNASFIVAPRGRTRGVNLSSRTFLHDYDCKKDAETGYQTLELIMTAPMVVTNWINMQYFASTVAPGVFGAGNKVLHNLTNETGVVEGNGGDLRVGLPLQSVFDGQRFVHDPLRLTVMIEAPVSEIERIIAKHAVVRDLIGNEWLHLVQIDPDRFEMRRRLRDGSYVAEPSAQVH